MTPSPLDLSLPWGGYSSASGSGETACQSAGQWVDPTIAYTERAPTEQEIKDNNLDPRQAVIVYGPGEEQRYQERLNTEAEAANDALHRTAEWPVYQEQLKKTIDDPKDAQAEADYQEALKALMETREYQEKVEAEKKAADGPPKFTEPKVNDVDPNAEDACQAMTEMTRVCNYYGWESPECAAYGGGGQEPDCGDPAPDVAVRTEFGPYPCSGQPIFVGGDDVYNIALLHCQIYGPDPAPNGGEPPQGPDDRPCQEIPVSGEARPTPSSTLVAIRKLRIKDAQL